MLNTTKHARSLTYLKYEFRHFIESMDSFGILALAGIMAPVVLIMTSMAATLSAPSYNFFRDSMSYLELTSAGDIQAIGFIVVGVLLEIFILGLFLNVRPNRGFHKGIGLLSIFGFGLLLAGFFRPVPTSVEGTIHLVLAFIVFGIFPVSLIFMLPSLKSDPNWRGIFPYTLATIFLAMSLDLARLFFPALLNLFGLYERILVANGLVWVEVVAIWLFLLSIRKRQEVKETQFQ